MESEKKYMLIYTAMLCKVTSSLIVLYSFYPPEFLFYIKLIIINKSTIVNHFLKLVDNGAFDKYISWKSHTITDKFVDNKQKLKLLLTNKT